MNKMKLDLRNSLFLLILILFLISIWFGKGLMLAGGEEGIPFYDIEQTSNLYFYSWRDSQGGRLNLEHLTRIPFYTVLRTINGFGLSGVVLQAVTFFVLMTTGVISFYFLLKTTITNDFRFKKQSLYIKYVPLIGALLYLLNPFSMTQVWGRGLYTQFFPFALFPLYLLFVVLGLKQKNLIYGVLATISSIVFSAAFGNLSYLMSFWFMISLYFIYYILTHKRKKNILFAGLYLLFLLVSFIATHIWWINYDLAVFSEATISRSVNLEHNLGTLRGVSRTYNIFDVLRLLHHFLNKAGFYGKIYFSLPFVLLSWIVPIAFIFSFKIIRGFRHYKFYLLVLLSSLFVVMGSNPPLGWLFEFLFKRLTFLQAFRNPYEKMGLVFTISYLPFVSIGLISVSEKIKSLLAKRNLLPKVETEFIVGFFILLISGVFLWPMWTGHISGVVHKPFLKVPDYYRQTSDWLNQDKSDFKILSLPLIPGDGTRYVWSGNAYQGTEPSEYIFSKHVVSFHSRVNGAFYKPLLDRFGLLDKETPDVDSDIINSEFKSSTFREEMEKLGVRYIVLHNDLDWEIINTKSSGEFAQYLEREEGVELVESFGELDIYKVSISDEIAEIYSPDVETKVVKINPAKYEVDVRNAPESIDLYFLNLFNPNWEAYVGGQKIEEHEKVFSYANSWRIEKAGNYTVILRYKPQDYIESGMKLSKYFLVSNLLLAGVLILRRRKNDH